MPAYVMPLAQVLASEQLPPSLRKLQHLEQKGIPIAPTALISPAALKKIAQKNHLSLRLLALPSSIQSEAHFKRTLNTFETHITKQSLPPSVSTELFEYYHSKLQDGAVLISIQSNDEAKPYYHTSFCASDRELVSSILTLWAQACVAQLGTPVGTKNLNQSIYNFTISLQKYPSEAVSGRAFTSNHLKHEPQKYTITANYGLTYNPKHHDTFIVDARTQAVISREVLHKRVATLLSRGRIIEASVAPPLQNQPALSDAALRKLTDYILRIKRSYFIEHQVSFAVERSSVWITHIEPFEAPTHQPQAKAKSKRARRLLHSTNQPHKLITTHDISDGVLLKSEYIFAQFGIYPPTALKTEHKRAILAKNVRQFLEKALSTYIGKQLLLRAYDYTSDQLEHFPHAGTTLQEKNPLLGQHGALHVLYQPGVLEFQYEIAAQVSKNHSLGFVIPFVRTQVEMQKIRRFLSVNTVALWFEIASPALLLQPKIIIESKPAGVIFNYAALSQLFYGYSNELTHGTTLYHNNSHALLERIQKAVRECERSGIQVLLSMQDTDPASIDSILRHTTCGCIVPQKEIKTTARVIEHHELSQVGGQWQ